MNQHTKRNSRLSKPEDRFIRKVGRNIVKVTDERAFVNNKDMELENFRIIEIVGNGANAVVLKATEDMTQRTVALKVWIPNLTIGKSNKTRSTQEIIKMAQLENRRIVRLHTAGISKAGYTYCVQELIHGKTLREKLEIDSMNLNQRYTILMQITEGLNASHEQNVYHGDLHLDNIMITDDNEVKILDFGTSVFSKDTSLERDSRLMFQTSVKLMGGKCGRLVDWHGKKVGQIPPHIVRMTVKAMGKIQVLLDFSTDGLTDEVIKDIARFTCYIPFFNLERITNTLFQRNSDISLIALFKHQLIDTMIENLEINYSLYQGKTDKDLVEENIQPLYDRLHDNFMRRFSKNCPEHSVMFRDQLRRFNENLYHISDVEDV